MYNMISCKFSVFFESPFSHLQLFLHLVLCCDTLGDLQNAG